MVTLGVLEGDLRTVSEGVAEGEESDLDGVLHGGGVQPEVRLEAVEREASEEGASREGEAATEVLARGGGDLEGDLGGGELSVVVAAQGAYSVVASVGEEAHGGFTSAGEGASRDQPASDRQAFGSVQEAGEETSLREDEAGNSSEAPDSHQG